MILSDKTLKAINYSRVRFDMTIKSLSHPADTEPVNQMWQEVDLDKIEHLLRVWSNMEEGSTVHMNFMAAVNQGCLLTKEGCSLNAPSNSGRQTLNFIIQRSRTSPGPMIHPFYESSIREIDGVKVPSFGLSSYGYDVTLQPRFKIFTNLHSGVIDPQNFDDKKNLHEVVGDECIIPPNSYALGYTKEYFCMPNGMIVLCVGKSTYARCGAIVNVTPMEPEFEGNIVIEISNATPLPMLIRAHSGIAQFMFFKGDQDAEVTYKSRNNGKGGKYQGQVGITLPRV